MKTKWLDLWLSARESILETMRSNFSAERECGYNPMGECVLRQRLAISDYAREIERRLELLADMDNDKAERCCYMDMRRRGDIA